MTDQSARTFTADFKRFFIRGLAILLPSVLTLWIIVQAYRFVDNTIAEPINAGVRTALGSLAGAWDPLRRQFDPSDEAVAAEYAAEATAGRNPDRELVRQRLRAANINAWWADRWYLDLIGLLLAIIAVYTAGKLLGGFVGRRIARRFEALIVGVPVLKQVYPHVKRLVDFLFGQGKRTSKFSRVVAVEYPRKGIWSIGFLTGEAMQAMAAISADSVTVFIPNSPTPITGYAITVPRREVMELSITVEEAVMFLVSGGVLVPSHETVPGSAAELPGRHPTAASKP